MLSLTTSAFSNGGEIPPEYTCSGQDNSPPLMWSGVPDNTRSLVLIIDDPDAPDPHAPKMTWVHWVVYNIPPNTTCLPQYANITNLPESATLGINDWHKIGYGGPCPPIGRHRYFHKLYALDTILKKIPDATKAQIEVAMQGHIIEYAELVGTFEKQG